MICSICGQRCTPLADYDATVCHRCDSAMENVLVRASLEPTVSVGVRRAACDRPHLDRPLASYFGPAKPEVLRALVDELVPRRRRPALEQPHAHPVTGVLT